MWLNDIFTLRWMKINDKQKRKERKKRKTDEKITATPKGRKNKNKFLKCVNGFWRDNRPLRNLIVWFVFVSTSSSTFACRLSSFRPCHSVSDLPKWKQRLLKLPFSSCQKWFNCIFLSCVFFYFFVQVRCALLGRSFSRNWIKLFSLKSRLFALFALQAAREKRTLRITQKNRNEISALPSNNPK